MLQVIVDVLKDPSSMQLHYIQSRGYGDGRKIKFDLTATNSYGANIRTSYYFLHGSGYWSDPSNWYTLIDSESQLYQESTWIDPDFEIRDENAEKILKRINLYS